MSKLTIVKKILDECSQAELENLFSPIRNLPAGTCSSKAEMISHCLNTELGAYGIKTYVSPDQMSILINDDTMCHIVDFFNKKGYQPYITQEQVNRVRTLQKVSNDNNINILWSQAGLRKKYYYFKQYGFNGVNLYNLLNINKINAATATLSVNGAAGLTMAGVIAISWSGSLFFSTVENYIPNDLVKIKATVSGAKFVIALPVRCVEWTSNAIFGFAENILFGSELPTNVTEVYRLQEGPKVKNLSKFKKPIIDWVIDKLKKL